MASMKSGVFMSARFLAHQDRKVVLLVGFIIYDGSRLPLNRRIVFHWGSMNTILIRQAVLSDIEALAPLLDQYRQFYGRESDLQAAREFLLARFNHGESVLFIASAGWKRDEQFIVYHYAI